MINPFRGCGTALITPFQGDGAVDEPAFRRLLRFQIDQGIDFLVPCGTTGETPTLTPKEHLRLIELAVEESRSGSRRVPVLGGAGGNNTAHVVELAREVERQGADGILTVAPYYNKPTQEGLYQHFATVAAATKLPVVLYNVPGRTSSNLEAATALASPRSATSWPSRRLRRISVRSPPSPPRRRRISICSPATTRSRCPSSPSAGRAWSASPPTPSPPPWPSWWPAPAPATSSRRARSISAIPAPPPSRPRWRAWAIAWRHCGFRWSPCATTPASICSA